MVTATRGRKNLKIDAAEQIKTLAKVKEMDAASLNDEFSQMQISVQKTFAGLQAEVNNRYATCQDLDTAISLKQSRLKELHGIEAAAIQLDDLQAELEAQRQHIATERADADVAEAELIAYRNQNRERDEDQWAYDTKQQHTKIQDEFNQAQLKRQRDEAARQEVLNKQWEDREKNLAEQEAELTSLRSQVDAFPTKMDAEVKKAVAINENSIKREYETKIALLAKDAEVNTKLNKERETALQGTIGRLESQNTALQTQVAASENRAAEVAKEAFASVSGQHALAAVQQSRNEAQSQQQGKQGR